MFDCHMCLEGVTLLEMNEKTTFHKKDKELANNDLRENNKIAFSSALFPIFFLSFSINIRTLKNKNV